MVEEVSSVVLVVFEVRVEQSLVATQHSHSDVQGHLSSSILSVF